MRVKFSRDFDFSPAAWKGLHTIAFKAGEEKVVTRECAAAAVAAGAGAVVRKGDGDGDGLR